ncbi:hypothetical protein J6590_027704 [Homalodisca vitripennis]|nr:hypothetical protein J6590_027704 [Homalodisca vitripennis]
MDSGNVIEDDLGLKVCLVEGQRMLVQRAHIAWETGSSPSPVLEPLEPLEL